MFSEGYFPRVGPGEGFFGGVFRGGYFSGVFSKDIFHGKVFSVGREIFPEGIVRGWG